MARCLVLALAAGCATPGAPHTPPIAPPEEPVAASAIEVTAEGQELIVRVGERVERLRYVEESRTTDSSETPDLHFNYPRVLARIESGDGGLILEVHCHDSYDDCGTNTDDLSCAVIEESSIDFEQLRLLNERLGNDSAVKLTAALGERTPIAACMARFNEADPETVWLNLEGNIEGSAAELDELYAMVSKAGESWPSDHVAAMEQMRAFEARLKLVDPRPDVGFAAAYGVERLQHTGSDAYVVPIIGPGGEAVPGAGELLRVYEKFAGELHTWEEGSPFPDPDSSLLRALRGLDEANAAVKAAAEQEIQLARERGQSSARLAQLSMAGAGYVAHFVFDATDDAWLFYLPDGRELQRMMFSSRDDAGDDYWPRP